MECGATPKEETRSLNGLRGLFYSEPKKTNRFSFCSFRGCAPTTPGTRRSRVAPLAHELMRKRPIGALSEDVGPLESSEFGATFNFW
jgi:hypothetical protein